MLNFRGIMHVAISAVIFGCTPLFAKNIYLLGGNPINLVFHRFAFSLPILFVLMIRFSNSIYLTKRETLKALILSTGFAGTPILLLSSYSYISSGLSTTIHFIYPVFVVLIYTLLFDRKVKPVKCLCTILCAIGIFLLYTPNQTSCITGIITAFASGATYAFYIIYLDRSGLKKLPSFKLTFYLSAFSAFELFIFSYLTNTLTFNIKPPGWILTIIFSILISIVATTLFQTGVKIIGPERAAILSSFEPITSIIIGVLVFNEELNFKTVIGVMLILVSVILLTKFDNDLNTSMTSK